MFNRFCGVVLGLAVALPAWADTCDKGGAPFAVVAASSPTVVRAQVVRQNLGPLAVELEVITPIKGARWLERIVLWGSTARDRAASVEDFEEGSVWVLALDEAVPSLTAAKGDKLRHFVFTRCGERVLAERRGMVIGRLDSAERREMPVKEFLARFGQGVKQ